MPRAQRAKDGSVKVYGHPKDARAFNATWPGAAIPSYTMAEFDRHGDLTDVQGVPDTAAGTAFVADLQAYAARQGLQPKRNPGGGQYGYRKGRDGWEVWLLAPATGDRRELLATVRSEREARSAVAKLEKGEAVSHAEVRSRLLRENPSVRRVGQVVYSFWSAESFLKGRDQRKLANNTWVVRLSPEIIGVKLHRTYIVKFLGRDGKVQYNMGGWDTVTTRQRIHAMLPPGFSLRRVGGESMLVRHGEPERAYPWEDGITIHSDGDVTDTMDHPITPVRLTPGGRVSTRQMRSNPPGRYESRPGKFEQSGLLGELLYNLIGDGGADEEIGSVDEQGWYGLMVGLNRAELEAAAEELDLTAELMDALRRKDVPGLHHAFSAIVSEDGQGFFNVDDLFLRSDHAERAREAWDELVEELAGSGDDEDDDDD